MKKKILITGAAGFVGFNTACRLLKEGYQVVSSDSLRGEVFNVGGGYENTISLLELAERWRLEPEFSDWRPADQKVFYCDISKAQKKFGWQPKIGLNEGLDRLLDSIKENLGIYKTL